MTTVLGVSLVQVSQNCHLCPSIEKVIAFPGKYDWTEFCTHSCAGKIVQILGL